MTTIYVVTGNTGEYSDYTDWIVCAYNSEDAAKARVIELETLMKTLGAVTDAAWDKRREAEDAMRKHEHGDQSFSMDYTGTRYGYEPVRLEDA